MLPEKRPGYSWWKNAFDSSSAMQFAACGRRECRPGKKVLHRGFIAGYFLDWKTMKIQRHVNKVSHTYCTNRRKSLVIC